LQHADDHCIVAVQPQYAGFANKASRVIPVIRLAAP